MIGCLKLVLVIVVDGRWCVFCCVVFVYVFICSIVWFFVVWCGIKIVLLCW